MSKEDRRRRRERVEVVVYTRAECGLCRAAEILAQAESGRRATVTLVDIDADPELQRRYNIRVPVVTMDGVEVLEGRLAPGEIAVAIHEARRRRADAAGAAPGTANGAAGGT